MNKYQEGKIYRIKPTVEHPDDDVYYGSTVQKLYNRFGGHKGGYCRKQRGEKVSNMTVFVLFDKYGRQNCMIELIDLFPCQSRQELERKEREWIVGNPCVNKILPAQNVEEKKERKKKYRKDNNIIFIKSNQKYTEKNREKLNEKQKEDRKKKDKTELTEHYKQRYKTLLETQTEQEKEKARLRKNELARARREKKKEMII